MPMAGKPFPEHVKVITIARLPAEYRTFSEFKLQTCAKGIILIPNE